MKSVALPPVSTEVRQANYCHLESRVSAARSLKVACAGLEHCKPTYHIKRSGYVCRGLELVIRGTGQLTLRGKTSRLLPGHIFLYGPGIAHEIRCDGHAPMSKYFADFYGISGRETWLEETIQPGEIRRVADPESLVLIFDSLIREGKASANARKEIAASYMKILLLKTAEAGPAQVRARSQSIDNLNRCRAYLEEHALSLPSLEALAAAMHLDARYICRLFKRSGLPPPYHSLVATKMNRAAEFLALGNEPVKSVASAVGFEDAMHFSRVFRKHFGCPPREFRDQHAKPR